MGIILEPTLLFLCFLEYQFNDYTGCDSVFFNAWRLQRQCVRDIYKHAATYGDVRSFVHRRQLLLQIGDKKANNKVLRVVFADSARGRSPASLRDVIRWKSYRLATYILSGSIGCGSAGPTA